jgi:hypothetical protein
MGDTLSSVEHSMLTKLDDKVGESPKCIEKNFGHEDNLFSLSSRAHRLSALDRSH